MAQRFFALWFRRLTTDYIALRRPALATAPFVLAAPEHGRMVITAVNRLAESQGIQTGMVVADARILLPGLEVIDDQAVLADKLLRALALWCIRYTPMAAIDPPDGLILDISGCAHLWGGERPYLTHIIMILRQKGYDVRGAIADTIGAAWAIAHYGRATPIIETGAHHTALLPLPNAALRLDPSTAARLNRLGLYKIHHIAGMARQALRTRFGNDLLLRIDQAFGQIDEIIHPVLPVEPYIERLPCLDPIRTAPGIEIALTRLLDTLCRRLQQDSKGLRTAVFKGYRVDGKIVQAAIGTHRATHNVPHLFKLFEEKIPTLQPDLGIEVFTLEAPKVEDVAPGQQTLWNGATGLQHPALSDLADRVANKAGADKIHRYLPAEHHWPERAIVVAGSFDQKAVTAWSTRRRRPIHILPRPEPIEVAAPIPDYPPMHFRHQGQFHKIIRSEGPERIEQEWWIDGARHRDYYAVEDQQGVRYWIFRAGHYAGLHSSQWYLHGYFA